MPIARSSRLKPPGEDPAGLLLQGNPMFAHGKQKNGSAPDLTLLPNLPLQPADLLRFVMGPYFYLSTHFTVLRSSGIIKRNVGA